MSITLVIDVNADIVSFAKDNRGETPLTVKLVEFMYAGAYKAGMPLPTKQRPGP